jgi:phage shock protein A
MEEQKTYLKRMAENLEQLDTNIAELKAGAEKATGQAKADLKRRLEDLRSTLDVARQRLEEFKGAGAEEWEALKGRAQKGWDDLSADFEKIKAKHKK